MRTGVQCALRDECSAQLSKYIHFQFRYRSSRVSHDSNMADLPQVLNISNFTQNSDKTRRLEALTNEFEQKYGVKPSFFARAPGRVNLIGEHIDYSGYGVLPMAVEQDILIAVNIREDKVLTIANLNSNYNGITTTVDSFEICKSQPQWFYYVLCGVKGIFEHLKLTAPVGMELMIDGRVPKSAGLSSSSAIVCASALATMHANKSNLNKTELATICTWSEQYIGTQGGGMDQSISFLAEKGTAKMIDFDPLKATSISLPEDACFVVSNSCVELNKAATSHFNTRVVESRLSAQLIAKANGMDWRNLSKMNKLQKKLGKSLQDLKIEVERHLHELPYNKAEICNILEITEEEFNNTILSEKTQNVDVFKLHDRALHIVTEANRVLKFKDECDNKVANTSKHLGKLMEESHQSCRNEYECSCKELDDLVKICMDSGALGSRLTGAGWAGCVVSLIPKIISEDFLQKVKDLYYVKRNLNCDASVLFITEPAHGAMIYAF